MLNASTLELAQNNYEAIRMSRQFLIVFVFPFFLVILRNVRLGLRVSGDA